MSLRACCGARAVAAPGPASACLGRQPAKGAEAAVRSAAWCACAVAARPLRPPARPPTQAAGTHPQSSPRAAWGRRRQAPAGTLQTRRRLPAVGGGPESCTEWHKPAGLRLRARLQMDIDRCLSPAPCPERQWPFPECPATPASPEPAAKEARRHPRAKPRWGSLVAHPKSPPRGPDSPAGPSSPLPGQCKRAGPGARQGRGGRHPHRRKAPFHVEEVRCKGRMGYVQRANNGNGFAPADHIQAPAAGAA